MMWLDVSVFAFLKHGEFVLLFDGLSMYSGPLPSGTDSYTFYTEPHVVALRCFFHKDSGVFSVCKYLMSRTLSCGSERMAVLVPGGWEISLNPGVQCWCGDVAVAY